ncbi:hypothetical protein [Ideonella sp. B508-1]|uniref:hypothetical protein n=1 Tax=Ideonella sp. B508-1 TaxID=137716 RepID=UPI0003479C1B|nr:hypothetical protein [Ideonella sp. B508-1]
MPAASLACIAHCQQLLAQGDTSLSPCLKAALDVNAVTEALLKLAGWSSTQAAPLAKASLPVYLACADACKEHAAHHAQCKACREACLAIIAAVQAMG